MPIASAPPNSLTYPSKDGEREIYLPPGTLEAACDHLLNERWDELDKFETYVHSELEPVPEPVLCKPIDHMVFKDKHGVEREIYIPPGTEKTALAHLMHGRWEELDKYEPYDKHLRSRVPASV